MQYSNRLFHPLLFVVIPILLLGAVFSMNHIWQYVVVITIAGCNLLLLVRTVRYHILIIFTLCLLPVIFAVFVSSYFFSHYSIISKTDTALLLSIRYFSLAIISFAFTIHTPFAYVFKYLMQHKILPVKIGYALLAAFNSFYFLAEEFRRMQIAYKMRYSKNHISLLIFITLLTAAARYAHNLSISMYSRGINNYKTFVHKIPNLKLQDYILSSINLAAIIVITLIE